MSEIMTSIQLFVFECRKEEQYEHGLSALYMPAEKYRSSPMGRNAIDGNSMAFPKSDREGLEKLPRMRDARCGTAEKAQNTSMRWHSSYEKKL